MNTSFRDIRVPLATPMDHGEIDLARLQMLADRLIAGGAHGLVVCGTTGEAPQLDLAEQSAVLSAVLETVHCRCPVLLGVGGSDTRAAVAARPAAPLREDCRRHRPPQYPRHEEVTA